MIIVGLGNPGSKYEKTRHNAGFMAIDFMSEKLGIKVNKAKFKSLIGECNIAGKRVIIMKPQTFMNLSGESVVELLTGLKLNGLTQNLFEIYKASSEALFADSSYIGLYENYEEFMQCYETLASVAKSKPAEKLEILSKDEQDIYIKEIETIRTQLKTKHKGQIYKGYDRIQ